jgi:hypothetical protein
LLAYPQSETQASDPKQQRQLPSSYWSMPINSLGIYYITKGKYKSGLVDYINPLFPNKILNFYMFKIFHCDF